MRRVYIVEILGLSDAATNALIFLILGAVACILIFAYLKSISAPKRRKIYLRVLAAAGALAVVALGVLLFTRGLPTQKAEHMLKQGRYEEAIELFQELELTDRMQQAQLAYANVLMEEGAYESAADLYETLKMDSEMCGALVGACREQLGNGQTQQAADLIRKVALMPEAAQLILENDALKAAVFAPGSSIKLTNTPKKSGKEAFSWMFGAYTGNNGRSYVWHVLESEDGRILLLSDPLGYSSFGGYYELPEEKAYEISWDKSSLRTKLNSEVYESFSEQIRNAIVPTSHTVEGYKLNMYNITEIKERFETVCSDKLFLLSCEQVAHCVDLIPDLLLRFEDPYPSHFWTSTPGTPTLSDTHMTAIKPADDGGIAITDANLCLDAAVRAAMWIDVDRLLQPH